MFFKYKFFIKTLSLLLITFFSLSCSKESVEPVESSYPEDSFSFQDESSTYVTEDLAKTIALNFGRENSLISKSSNFRTSQKKIEVEEFIIIPDELGEPAIYVMNYSGTGYLIVSATLKESPILGFSDTEHFDVENIPLGMAEWFYDRMHKIQVIKNDATYEIPKQVSDEWYAITKPSNSTNANAKLSAAVPISSSTEQYGPLLTTFWGQGVPYNDLVPKTGCSTYSNGRAPTGCVATAIAQVARYHARSSSYNWSIMPNQLFSSYSGTTGANEVARLLRDIGNWVGMDYGCDGSGAQTGDAVAVFRNRLGYSSGGNYQTLSISNAEPLVKNDIKSNRPVIMAGNHGYYTYTTGWWLWKKTKTAYTNGHAWVCDGYKRESITVRIFPNPTPRTYVNDYYHMNWGWNRSGMYSNNNNGWFRFDNIAINGSTTKGENTNFKYNRRYITGIRP